METALLVAMNLVCLGIGFAFAYLVFLKKRFNIAIEHLEELIELQERTNEVYESLLCCIAAEFGDKNAVYELLSTCLADRRVSVARQKVNFEMLLSKKG